MKFSVSSNELQKGFSKISGVIPSKSTLPILENILLELSKTALTITATDLEISMKVVVQVKGSEDGKIAVPAKRTIETIRSLPDVNLTFTADTSTNKILMSTESGEYKLTGETSEEFPATPEFKGSEEISFDSSTLSRLINKTVFAVSTDELRPSMMGVLFQIKEKDFRAVSTDGHRLVRIINKKIPTHKLHRDVIIPAKALNLVSKSVTDESEQTIALNETHVMFKFGSTTLISRLIEENYPNYESVIPQDNDKVLAVGRDALLASVRRVALYSSATTHQIRFSPKKDEMKISAEDVDFGGEAVEKITCDYSAEPMDIGFNAMYIIEILNHIDTDDIVFKFSSPTRAGIVQPATQREDEDVLMLVMPVRLNV